MPWSADWREGRRRYTFTRVSVRVDLAIRLQLAEEHARQCWRRPRTVQRRLGGSPRLRRAVRPQPLARGSAAGNAGLLRLVPRLPGPWCREHGKTSPPPGRSLPPDIAPRGRRIQHICREGPSICRNWAMARQPGTSRVPTQSHRRYAVGVGRLDRRHSPGIWVARTFRSSRPASYRRGLT